jgi:serine/threonine protein kinase
MTESQAPMDDDDVLAMKNFRVVGSHLVSEPIAPKECIMKTGRKKDCYIVDNNDGTVAQFKCIQADEDASVPFEIGKRIKDAICGDVYTGFKLQVSDDSCYKRNEMVVIKVISLQKLDQLKRKGNIQEDPIKEISILQLFNDNSNHVCSQMDCIRDDKYIYSIMRHYGDELFNYAGKITEEECRTYFRQIIEGVKELQRFNVCHRDLSLENILLSSDGVCTIIDFGMALLYPTAKPSSLHTIFQSLSSHPKPHFQSYANDEEHVVLLSPQGTCGKKNYIAPEILSNLHPFNGAMVDNWSLGVILFMLLTGRPPFQQASSLNKWYRMIQQGKIRDTLNIFKIDHLSDDSVDLLQKLLTGSNCHSRMAASDILLHPWLSLSPTNADDSCSGA